MAKNEHAETRSLFHLSSELETRKEEEEEEEEEEDLCGERERARAPFGKTKTKKEGKKKNQQRTSVRFSLSLSFGGGGISSSSSSSSRVFSFACLFVTFFISFPVKKFVPITTFSVRAPAHHHAARERCLCRTTPLDASP